MKGIVRVAAAVPPVAIGNVDKNLSNIRAYIEKARAARVGVLAFPEMALTGYTCGDLFFQEPLLRRAREALLELREDIPDDMLVVVGAPLEIEGQLYNCGVVYTSQGIEGVAVKTYIPNYGEFYEKRWFQSAHQLPSDYITDGDLECPVGNRLIFCSEDGLKLGVELCEDLWSPLPPSTRLTTQGAEIVLNLSASNEIIGKREYRRELVKQQSARCLCGYVYASAGSDESTSDLIFSGHSLVAAGGAMLAESVNEIDNDYLLVTDIDMDVIRADRRRDKSFADAAQTVFAEEAAELVRCDSYWLLPDEVMPEHLNVNKAPFVPAAKSDRTARCDTIFAMQASALARRLRITGGKVTVGISGGLDSTLALLAAARAMSLLGLPMSHITGVTMPCFGTSDDTYKNALELMTALGVTQRDISITAAVRQHFRDIGHDENDHSVTYENAQARERTQVLMDIANQTGGIVLGTGDLSEIALGWCTYNADHMSMYGVNSGVPKTLVRWIIQTVAESTMFPAAEAVLRRILDTPISPELLPPDETGRIAQKTEDLVGPYALHDFFLYQVVRYGRSPRKVFELARMAFKADFDAATILKWLKTFYRRFFSQQFKRNCMPDGVKIGSVALSPRGDWRMPSDAESQLWLSELERL